MPVALPPPPPAIIKAVPVCSNIFGFPFKRRQCPNADPQMARIFMMAAWRNAAAKYGPSKATARAFKGVQCVLTRPTPFVGSLDCWVRGRAAPGKKQGVIVIWEDGSWRIYWVPPSKPAPYNPPLAG